MVMSGYARTLLHRFTLTPFGIQREAIVSTFTQASGALAAVNADWMVATDFEQQPTGTANIQYVTANVFQDQNQNGLGLKASAVSVSNISFDTVLKVYHISMTTVAL
jgi:hypothetical protein